MATLKRLKFVNDRYKLTVFGYIHENEKILSVSNIPSMIGYLCLLYYFHGEYFEKSSNNIEKSNDKLTITRNRGSQNWNCFAFGKVWIDSMIKCVAKWKFKINYIDDDSSYFHRAHIIIHLISKEGDFDRVGDMKYAPYYKINGNGFVLKKEISDTFTTNEMTLSVSKFRINDEIVLILDTVKGTISLKRNDEEIQCVFKNIDRNNKIRYKLAVLLYDVKYSITLTDFDCKIS